MEEVWRDIPGWEGLYQASTLGRIRSLKYYGGSRIHLKATKLSKNGYVMVTLCRNGEEYTKTVNHLVALTFIPNPNDYPEVNHKDECKTNNAVTNLEWCDHLYNLRYGTGSERAHKKTRKPVIQYTIAGDFIKEWESATAIKNELGYDNTLIGRVCAGYAHYNTAYGYKWKYKRED